MCNLRKRNKRIAKTKQDAHTDTEGRLVVPRGEGWEGKWERGPVCRDVWRPDLVVNRHRVYRRQAEMLHPWNITPYKPCYLNKINLKNRAAVLVHIEKRDPENTWLYPRCLFHSPLAAKEGTDLWPGTEYQNNNCRDQINYYNWSLLSWFRRESRHQYTVSLQCFVFTIKT